MPDNESQRLKALLRCEILDTLPEPAFDDLTRLAAQLCETPIALVSLLDDHRQWFKSKVGVDAEQTPREQAFCGYTILGEGPLVIRDARTDPRTADNPLVTGSPGIRFYAAFPLRLSTGEALGSFCVIDLEPRDISGAQLDVLHALALQAASQLELRSTLRQLDEAAQAARVASAAKSEFLAHLSHEIRTPMTAIIGYSNLIYEEAAGDAQVQQQVDIIRHNGQYLLELLNDVLDLSKIEAGRLEVECFPCSLIEIVAGVQAVLKTMADGKGLQFTCACDGPVPEVIHTDPTRLRQILINLIGNAIKFTHAGSVKAVAACAQSDSGARIQIRISDTGIGIPSENLQKIFSPFTQADASITREYGGTGLGLSICRRLAEMLGGRIEVQSTPGAGSCFTVEIDPGDLTGVRMIHDPVESGTPLRAAASTERMLLNGHVLLVEDTPVNQNLIRMLLQRMGLDVTVTNNGREALDQLDQRSFDLVLLDLQMPVMDGLTTMSQIKKRGLKIPVVALTATAMSHLREENMHAGFSGYVTKPVDMRVMGNELARHLSTAKTSPVGGSSATESVLFEPQEAIERLGLDEASYMLVLQDAIQFVQRKVEELQLAVHTAESEAISDLAHALASCTGNIGMGGICHALKQLEADCGRNAIDQIQQQFQQIRADLACALQSATQYAQGAGQTSAACE